MSGLGPCSSLRPLSPSSESQDDLPTGRGNLEEAFQDPQMASVALTAARTVFLHSVHLPNERARNRQALGIPDPFAKSLSWLDFRCVELRPNPGGFLLPGRCFFLTIVAQAYILVGFVPTPI